MSDFCGWGRRRHDCAGSEELLERVNRAEADLDRWFEMEGARAGTQESILALRGELAATAAALSCARRSASSCHNAEYGTSHGKCNE